MGKKDRQEGSEPGAPECLKQISPIANPLFDGKLLERSNKLVRKIVDEERSLRQAAKTKGGKAPRLLRRGVVDVTKALRKGERGIVFLAADVFPEDIIAHLPIFCEEKDVAYGYVGSKQTLGAACRSARPASVIMVVAPPKDASEEVLSLFEKTVSAARKANPYLN